MEIVILDARTTMQSDVNFDALGKFGTLTVYDRTSKNEVVARAKNADVLLINKIILSREVIESLPKLKYVGLISTGYNVVDLDACRERGIPVCNVPAYSTPSVTQLTFSLILEICNGVGAHSVAVSNGDWHKSKDFCFVNTKQIELQNKTIGIIGYGSIGRSVANVALALGMKVIAYSRNGKSGETETNLLVTNTLDDIYSKADVISLHCPLGSNNTEFINRESIAKMKDGVIIINTARGGLLREQDVADGLKSGKIYAFGADVLSSEPPSVDNPLQYSPNTFVTPHIAWASTEARSRLSAIAIQNVENYLAGNVSNNVAK